MGSRASKGGVLWAVVVATAAMGASGCSQGDEQSPTLLPRPDAGEGLQIALHAHLEPGQEVTTCAHFVVPVDAALPVARFEHRYSPGSHHFLLYRTNLAPEDARDDTWECGSEQIASPVAYAAQAPDGELEFPDGVALTFQAGEVLLAQAHYLNASAEPLDPEVNLNLWRSAVPATVEAGTLFFYDWAIVVPPGDSSAGMHCVVPEDIELVFAMSHMHRRGVRYESRIVDALVDAEPAGPDALYETTAWEDVVPAVYAPAVHVRAGQAIDFDCHYRNNEDRTILEGPSAVDNEMCMFVGTYFPKMDVAAESCLAPGSSPIFTGTQSCGQTLTCQVLAADDVAAEQCLLDTCAGSAPALTTFGGCLFQKCGDVCDMNGSASPDCLSCMTAECNEPLEACQAAGC